MIDTVKTSDDAKVAFFYCEHQYAKKRDSRTVLSTILSDLIGQLGPHLPSPLTTAIMDAFASKKTPTLEVLGGLICIASRVSSKVFVIIDALDECEDRSKLFPIIKTISQSVSVLVTSRDERDIRRGLQQPEMQRHQYIPIRPEDLTDEIGEFIHKEIQDRMQKRSLVVRVPDLVNEIAQALTRRSDGM